eukprot:TRINITY_DN10462_c0_g1_i1.p1 TRINITY_DN10462_c0_g1~~TRINITY_DN10462_c0_g1_i1.p1  ORF type:complete len:352 (-),score=40.69 TRINITY_DN10462_c0_g1_i1:114-1169(-)
MPRCSTACCASVCCPCSRDSVVHSGSDLICVGLGFLTAFAWIRACRQGIVEAMCAADDENCTASGPLFGFAIVVTLLCILAVMGLIWLRRFSSRDAVHAVVHLFQVICAVLTAYAWDDAWRSLLTDRLVWRFVYAFVLTICALVAIWCTRLLYHKVSTHPSCCCFFVRYAHALAVLAPIWFMFHCGLAWTGFVEAIALELIAEGDSVGAVVVLLFVFALLMTIVGLILTIVVQRFSESGCSCCTCTRQPRVRQGCCGMPQYLAEPLTMMCLGTLAALCAFAWSNAFFCTFVAISDEADDVAQPVSVRCSVPEDRWWLLLIYACLVTPFSLWLLLMAHRHFGLHGGGKVGSV